MEGRMPKFLLLLLPALLPLTSGCMAIKSTVYLTRGEQSLLAAEEAGSPELAVYYWTMADEFQRKAREEWGYSDFGVAEDLSRKSAEWAARAQATSTNNSRIRDVTPGGDALQDQAPVPARPADPAKPADPTKPTSSGPIWGDE